MAYRLQPRCYICGSEVKKNFVLFSLNESPDRVFVAHRDCANQVSDAPFLLTVEEKEEN